MALVATLSIPASAHPGSGIVVDDKDEVFFADLSRGLLKIDGQGKVTSVHKEGGHWLALDPEGSSSLVEFELTALVAAFPGRGWGWAGADGAIRPNVAIVFSGSGSGRPF